MRIVVHDYSGHPFQVQLSRELARRGHEVGHWYCSSYTSGHGGLTLQESDPKGFTILPIPMSSSFDRYSPVKRTWQEITYGLDLGRRLARHRPDVVLFCNTPLIAHAVAARVCRWARLPMIFWQQDIYSAAIAASAAKRLGAVGGLIGRAAGNIERSIARNSRAVIAISKDFLPMLERWGVRERTTVVPNWAPLPEIPGRHRDNPWAAQHDLVGRHVVLYAGTLGLKHNPAVLLSVARSMAVRFPEGRVVVISEGRGREWLAEQETGEDLANLVLLDYQPYESLPDVLGSADVLVAILEPDAGRFSVPSKILTYLCAGRAIAALIPADNAAASVLRVSGGGVVVEPGENERAVNAIMDLLADERGRSEIAAAGRTYAANTFDINGIANRFEEILMTATKITA